MPSHTSKERAKKKSGHKPTKASGKTPAQKKKMMQMKKKSKKGNR